MKIDIKNTGINLSVITLMFISIGKGLLVVTGLDVISIIESLYNGIVILLIAITIIFLVWGKIKEENS